MTSCIPQKKIYTTNYYFIKEKKNQIINPRYTDHILVYYKEITNLNLRRIDGKSHTFCEIILNIINSSPKKRKKINGLIIHDLQQNIKK